MTARPSLGQDLVWRLEAGAYDVLTFLFRLAPVDVASALGGMLFRLIGPLNPAHRTAQINLKLAFPEKSEAWRRKTLADNWEQMGRGFAEFPHMDRIRIGTGRVEIVNRERLDEIAHSGKATVMISGHLSNWEAMAAAVLESGVPLVVTYRAANNPYMDRRIRESRAAYGVQMFAPKGGEGAREMLDYLAKGISVGLLNDQKFNSGVEGPFFGHTAHTAPGPTRMALRFGIDLQPVSVQRTKGARFKVVVHDPIVLERTGDRTADIAAGVARINAFMEERIRERPWEWFWVHKRWPAEVYRGDKGAKA